jgi:alcohol dehydrogenase YqhD (iron-dependent ADH family)
VFSCLIILIAKALDHARDKFRQIHSEWSKRSDEIQKKYDSAIKKSRPYYEAVREEQRLRDLAMQATSRFEKANSMLQVGIILQILN